MAKVTGASVLIATTGGLATPIVGVGMLGTFDSARNEERIIGERLDESMTTLQTAYAAYGGFMYG